MKRTIGEQRKITIRPGYSPKPASAVEPRMEDSPSDSWEPDTHSPQALLEGPIVQRRKSAKAPGGVSVNDGVVSFGK
jgi:hypothetical protein